MKKRVMIGILILCIAAAVLVPTLIKSNSARKNGINDIKTTVNGPFSISLDENPSTGYSWHIVIENPEVSKVVNDDYSQIGKLLGSGGVHKWEFKGLKIGSTTIKMDLYRSWEPTQIVDSKIFNVTVH